ncbi:MAG: hypothetical protein HUU35_06155 [Armatimonadetes bacterium]|nr:hypothetical protein [Armatimonadota bacterium]
MPKALLWIPMLVGLAGAQAPRLAEPWQAPYQGADANGPHVIGYWRFEPGAEAKDSAGKQGDLQIKGKINPAGRFGACLESDAGYPVSDTPHGAQVPAHASLTPTGAFSIDFWLKLKPAAEAYANSPHLLDKKYVAKDHVDYQVVLDRLDGGKLRRVRANLGFGDTTLTFASDPLRFEPDTWYHVAFVYDGAGSGRFYRNGAGIGGASYPGRTGLTAGKRPLSIGDRLGSNHAGLPGYLDEVRIVNGALEFGRVALTRESDRAAFLRLEPNAKVRFGVTNLERTPLSGATLRVGLRGQNSQLSKLPDIAPGAKEVVELAVDTSLRPDGYELVAQLEVPGEPPYRTEQRFPLNIVARPLPWRMPVVMWGVGGVDPVLQEIPRLKELGFTHCLGLSCDYDAVWKATEPTATGTPEAVAEARAMLDRALVSGVGVVAGLSPGRWARDKAELRRVRRDGTPYPGEHADICASRPEVVAFCERVGASMARDYGQYPAWDSALLHTEVRGETRPCFHDWDRAAFKEATGLDIPASVGERYNGVDYQQIQGFPTDRVIPDDDPVYRYFQWFWRQGDGWNQLQTALHKGLKDGTHPDFWTFHDPAARVLSVYGSGGAVDYLAHWTYSYPEPIRIGLCTEELLCMARGASTPQQVMKMTQIIWYRSQTAPEPGEQAQTQAATFNDQDVRPQGGGEATTNLPRSDWERAKPDARFITISPMHLREAFWSKIARPIQGIMYHGWGSLVPDADTAYRYTHPDTRYELQRLARNVVEPLGPALRQVPGIPSDVALLESFASQIYARRGTMGWNGSWTGDMFLVLQYAGLQPEVIYDETVARQGLDSYKVLVIPDGDVLTAGVVQAVKAFQARGGLVVGDDRLCPAITADIVVPARDRTKNAAEDKAAMLQRAADLRRALDGHYQRVVDSSTPEVVVHRRRAGQADYVFAINDRREYGDYVGHHKLVEENGLPAETTLSLRRGGHVYDLVASRELPCRQEGQVARVELALEPGDGRVLMVTEQPITRVVVEVSEAARRGESLALAAQVVDPAGRPIDAVIPLRLEVLDPSGRPAEFSGYHAAVGGKFAQTVDLAANDQPGLWLVRLTELASGQVAKAYVRVH